jgi:hypothetical protein
VEVALTRHHWGLVLLPLLELRQEPADIFYIAL